MVNMRRAADHAVYVAARIGDWEQQVRADERERIANDGLSWVAARERERIAQEIEAFHAAECGPPESPWSHVCTCVTAAAIARREQS